MSFELGVFLAWEQPLNVLKHQLADQTNSLFAHGHGRPMPFDEVLEVVGLDRFEGAAILEPLATEAVEVVVEVASTIARLLEGQGLAATTAVDRPLQVVGVSTRLLSTLVTTPANALDLGVKLFADQRLVLARVLNAFERDNAGVVAVAQDGVYVRVGKRSARAAWAREGRDPVFHEAEATADLITSVQGDCE